MLRVIWDGLSCTQLECEELFNTHLDVNLETALLALLVFWEGQLRQCIKKKTFHSSSEKWRQGFGPADP